MYGKSSTADYPRQFGRDWGQGRPRAKFLSEMDSRDLDRLCLDEGERVLRKLRLVLLDRMSREERNDLARALGRPLVRLARDRLAAGKAAAGRRPAAGQR